MFSIKSYKDLITEIDLCNMRIEALEAEREIYKKSIYNNAPKEMSGQVYSDMPCGSKNYMSLDRIVEAINRIDNALYIERERIKILQELEKESSGKLKNFRGLEYKIMYYKEIENMSIQEIADTLGYSYQTIANAICDMNKREE